MLAVSVRQPFARFILTGKKKFEVRNWQIEHRGDLLFCASKATFKGEYLSGGELIDAREIVDLSPELYPKGVAMCVVNITGCRPMTEADNADAMYPAFEGAYVWEWDNVRPVEQVEIRGVLKLYTVDDSLIRYL